MKDDGVHTPYFSRTLGLIIMLFLPLVMFNEFFTALCKKRIISYVDEFVIVAAMALLFGDVIVKHRISKDTCIYLIMLVVLVVISIPAPYFLGIVTSATASFLVCKIFVWFVILRRLLPDLFRTAIKTLVVVHLIGFFLNILFPEFFNLYLPDLGYIETYRLVGFQLNPNRFAMLSVALGLYYFSVEKNKWMFFIMVVSILPTYSMSSAVFLVLLICYYLVCMGKRKGIVQPHAVILFIALVLTMFGGFWLMRERLKVNVAKIEATSSGEGRYIRYAMLRFGVLLAIRNAPFGVGAGNFGSALSMGSRVYEDLGIAEWPSVKEGFGIHDSGIGSFLGEYGFLGLVLCCFFLYLLFKTQGLDKKGSLFMVLLVIIMSFFREVMSSSYYGIVMYIVLLSMRSASALSYEDNRLVRESK